VVDAVRAVVLVEGHIPVATHDLDAPVVAVQGQDALRVRLPVSHAVVSSGCPTMRPSLTYFRMRVTRAVLRIVGHSLRMSTPSAATAGTAIRSW